jgi:hypothetical protein
MVTQNPFSRKKSDGGEMRSTKLETGGFIGDCRFPLESAN